MAEEPENLEENFRQDTIQDFCDLIATIMDYFDAQYDDEETEEWKKKTIQMDGRRESIPADLDKLIIKAFKSQVNKFVD